MAFIVQKYGGTSVGTTQRIQAVAQRIVATVKAGNSVVVVVSAMGKTTDGLVKLAHEISGNPSRREMDVLLSTGEQITIALLSMALQELGQPAVSMTGAQVGIVTETAHTRARILRITTERIERHLQSGYVVVVAGFQGVSDTEDWEITTLGRGGSDTSAVALAAALHADQCEIYTDVPGILTTDPRLVPEARLMEEITSDEMLELASLGAKVLHPRAVEIARNYGVTLVVRSSWTDEPGTKVVSLTPQNRSLEGLEIARSVDAVEFDTQQSRVGLLRIPDRPGIAASLFDQIAKEQVDVDLIIQSIHEGETNDITFTVNRRSIACAEAVATSILPNLLAGFTPHPDAIPEVVVNPQVAKVSIVGAGMIGRPGVAAQMFTILAQAGINIQMISTSEVKVSCVIESFTETTVDELCHRALHALQAVFEVDSSPTPFRQDEKIGVHGGSQPYPVVRGVALDMKQVRLAIRDVPHRPGMASQLFQLLADHGISVDMIIQSQRCHETNTFHYRDIACTVAETDGEMARSVLESAMTNLGYGAVMIDRAIAKVSIVGAGMVNHPGVAARMFAALSERQINIQMIATSEIKISCVVDKSKGVEALQAIHQTFHLAGNYPIHIPS